MYKYHAECTITFVSYDCTTPAEACRFRDPAFVLPRAFSAFPAFPARPSSVLETTFDAFTDSFSSSLPLVVSHSNFPPLSQPSVGSLSDQLHLRCTYSIQRNFYQSNFNEFVGIPPVFRFALQFNMPCRFPRQEENRTRRLPMTSPPIRMNLPRLLLHQCEYP